ncbi:MAG: HAMP domain-containing protein [Firmicutes bacterium]|nr:HAMP domain-containing protein [Bacillota bacterium]
MVIVVALGIPALALSQLIQGYFFAAKERELVAKGQEIAGIAADFLEGRADEASTNRILDALDSFVDARVWVIDRTGLIVAASHGGMGAGMGMGMGMEMRMGRGYGWGRLRGVRLVHEDIQRILAGEVVLRRAPLSRVMRHMQPRMPLPGEGGISLVDQQVISAGIPVWRGPEVVGGIILNSPVRGILAATTQLRRYILYAGLAALAISLLLAYSLSRRISLPIRQMSEATARMARGDFKGRVPVGMDADAHEDRGIAMNRGGDEITELARSFNHMAEQLGRIEENRREFVANVSHELRAPLTTIRGFIQALIDGTVEDEEQREKYLRLIRDEAIRMNRLLSDLLDLSRLEAGKIRMELAPVSLKEIIESAVAKVALRAASAGITIEDRVPAEPDGLPFVMADGDRIEQVLTNLIDNAIHATPAGGRITLSAAVVPPFPFIPRKQQAAPASYVRVSVRDTGKGIPAEDLPFVWERFYKVDKARSRAEGVGTGIGLAIVKQIVEAHGGEVGVESEVGRGSEFWFTLRAAI